MSMGAMARAMAANIRISRMKRVARKHYEAHGSLCSRFDCGAALAAFISPSIAYHAARFNSAMTVLERLDPECPKGKRLEA